MGICCWFSSLLQEVFIWVLQFPPLLKNQHFQIPNRSGTHGHFSPSCYELLSVPWETITITIEWIDFQLNYWNCLNLLCYTVEPRLNEGPREWQNVFAITRSFFIYFSYIRYIKDFLIWVFVISRFHCSSKGKPNLAATCAIWLTKWQWWYFEFLSLSAICLFSNFFRMSHFKNRLFF